MSRFRRVGTGVSLGGGLLVVAAALAVRFRAPPAPPPSPIVLHDVTAETGVTFRHTDGSSGRRYIVESVASGLATFDYDGDGLIDIYFLTGRPLPGTETGEPVTNRLYRNLGDFRFVDVTEEAGVGDAGYGLGVTVGDYDNDGCPDLYVSNFGPKKLYHNNGDGTFTDVTTQAAVDDGDKVGAGVAFLDIDNNGVLDLYVANYVDFTFQNYRPKILDGIHIYPGPMDFNGVQDTLFRNQGDGAFRDITREAGIAGHVGTGMGIVCADYDNDGDTDIFVLNDVSRNFLFVNDGTGKFSEQGLLAGFAYDGNGQSLGSMGVDCADYDHDGWLDFFQTSYAGEFPVLRRNTGKGYFEDVTLLTGAGDGSFKHVNWGCGFVDFDNDGWRDLYIACGHIQDNAELTEPGAEYEARNVLLRNTGAGKFVNVSEHSGDGMQVKRSSRGAAFDDLDNDGDGDVVVLNSRERSTILRNLHSESHGRNHWLQLRLVGVKANRDGVGARVRVVAGDLTQIDEVHSGRGYQSHWGSRLHFGLGTHDRVDRLEVHWPGGGVDVLENVRADQLTTIVEGRTAANRDGGG
jgi:hypothetical protein